MYFKKLLWPSSSKFTIRSSLIAPFKRDERCNYVVKEGGNLTARDLLRGGMRSFLRGRWLNTGENSITKIQLSFSPENSSIPSHSSSFSRNCLSFSIESSFFFFLFRTMILWILKLLFLSRVSRFFEEFFLFFLRFKKPVTNINITIVYALSRKVN